MSDNHPCPADAEFAATEELLAAFPDLHPEPEQVHGFLCVYRRSLAEVRKRYHCDGATVDDKGGYECPLLSAAGSAMTAAFGQPRQWRVPMEQFVSGKKENDTTQSGQFL